MAKDELDLSPADKIKQEEKKRDKKKERKKRNKEIKDSIVDKPTAEATDD
jgi:hypothetical protein